MSHMPRDHRSVNQKEKEEDRSILEDLSFCDLMDDMCTEGSGKMQQYSEMLHLRGFLDHRRQWVQTFESIYLSVRF